MSRFAVSRCRSPVADGVAPGRWSVFARSASSGPGLVWWIAIMMVLWASGVAQAAEQGTAAHVHGVSKLNLAIDGNRVALEIGAPGADIVGFEHIAETREDKAAVNHAVGILKAGDTLFRFSARAKCRLQAAEVEPPKAAQESTVRDADSGKAKEAVKREKGHTEFYARYEFRCDQPASLTEVDAGNFFKRFPVAREIEARAVTAMGQRAQELTPAAAKLAF